MKPKSLFVGALTSALVVLAGCGEEREPAAQPATQREEDTRVPEQPTGGAVDPHGAQGIPPAFAARNPGGPDGPGGDITGTVTETMNSGGYTYLHVNTGASSMWAAVSQMTLAVGDRVQVAPGSMMQGFHSNTLDRTFDQILFSSGARVIGVGNTAAGDTAAGNTAAGNTAAGNTAAGNTAAPNAAGAAGTGGLLPAPSSPTLPPGHPPVDRGATP